MIEVKRRHRKATKAAWKLEYERLKSQLEHADKVAEEDGGMDSSLEIPASYIVLEVFFLFFFFVKNKRSLSSCYRP